MLLLLLVIGQMSGELCMARCEGMAKMAPSCGMPDMAHGHCAMCKHASADGTSSVLSAPKACSGQICNSVLGLLQNRHDSGIATLVAAVSLPFATPAFLEGNIPMRFRAARSPGSIPPFDLLISSLRI